MQGNTTALIGAWRMDDTGEGLVGRFQSAIDINAIVSAMRTPSGDVVPSEAAHPPLLMKSADEDDWTVLPAGAPGSAY